MSSEFILKFPPCSLHDAQAQADAVENSLEFDALAVSIAEHDEAASLWQTLAYFAKHEEAQAALHHFHLQEDAISVLPQTDWVRQSLSGLSPVTAGRFFLYGSHDRHQRKAGGINIELDAQTAFGTGHHGTTSGCLLAFDAIAKSRLPTRVLDLGCGSGVLALAAAKIRCQHVLATDIDPEAIAITRSNAKINSVAGLKTATAVGTSHELIRKHAPYDLIFANILAGPLATMAYQIASLLKGNGQAILSGLTTDQVRWIRACYVNAGLAFRTGLVREGWATLVMAKQSER